MAKSKNSKQSDAVSAESLTRKENVRLIAGFSLVILGIFLICSIISYLFYWKVDMSAINNVNPRIDVEFSNICGPMGARVAQKMVGGGFGLFAIIIPLFITVLGWRLFRFKSLRLYRFGLICALTLLMGSLTLGATFDTAWELFGSGLGGDYGLALNNWLTAHIGTIGTILVIIIGWISIGILINRNFLQLLGNWCVAGYERAMAYAKVEIAKLRDRRRRRDVEDEFEAETLAAEAAKVEEPVAEVAVSAEEPSKAVAVACDEDDIFVVQPRDDIETEEIVPDEEDVTEKVVMPAEEVAEPTPQPMSAPVYPEDDFYVVPRDEEEGGDVPVSHNAAANILGIEDSPAEGEGIVVTVTENGVKEVDEDDINSDLYDPMRDLHNYQAPTPALLRDHKSQSAFDEEEIFRNKERIRETLLHFHIPIISMHATVGPTVTLYEIVQEPGVKISRIQGLEDDLAQNLKAEKVRIIAPIPGKGTVGIEVPNQTKQTVSMRSAICSEEFQNSKAELPVVIGRTIQNVNYTFDLAKMPHLLVAGATGQGKSVGLNAIITSLLYRKHPAELKFVLIDPKMVEFSLYNKLERHFLAKMESEDESIVTDPKKAVYTLNALCTEMANRLELCKAAHAKNIVEYNEKFVARRLNPENGHRYLPYIVVIIDEFADLIMTAKEVEAPVMRLAQKARAIGIHLIVATQRPDVKVITGGIKANFPARIAFRVMQMTDSRTIIDQPGANQLIGRGDMLFLSGGEPTRIQCAFVDTPEVENIVEHIGAQQGYSSAYNLPDYVPADGAGEASVGFGSEESGAPQKFDAKFGEIAREAVSSGAISTSMIQRNFEVGFNRAGRIMLQLERAGIVGPQIGSKPREIKYYDLQSLEARLQELGVF
ncbi:MAG: DNA translocase FtsK 4TM domain-containing protein [Alistipes sp.]|nr:DNA translocase FtsK 4TM domain-containing protein [Alistipes sp.]